MTTDRDSAAMPHRMNAAEADLSTPPHSGPSLLERILWFSVQNRWLVIVMVVAMGALGVRSLVRLPIDAIPDITNVQVQINTVVEGLSPIEVEKRVTFPIETALAGIPALESTRSLSRYGLSQVTAVFRDGTSIYFARQLVNERLQDARGMLPDGIDEPEMGPIATGLGEIFMWTVSAKPGAVKSDGSPYTQIDLREIEDWVIRPQLHTVPGVTEVNTIGGYRKEYHVTPDPNRLVAYGLTFHDLILAIEANNAEAGGGYIERKGEQYLVSSSGRLRSPDEIEDVVVATRSGVPLRLRDVASVGVGKEMRTGAATMNGEEVVLGTAFMLIGENSRTVSKALAQRLQEVNRTLPPGVVAEVVYDRTKLVEATLHTVEKNLLEGAALVVAVLFALLGNFTAAFLVALVIPLSMLFAATGMVQGKISANLLSLGAIDFGIIVDGAVVVIENVIRRFGHEQARLGRLLTTRERLQEAYAASAQVARPTVFGVAAIMIVYLPILTLQGIEGKMFIPMAQVVLLAIGGALLLTLTFVPAAVAIFLRGKVAEKPSAVLGAVQRAYDPTLRWAVRRRGIVLAGAAVVLAVTGLAATRLGSEFVPQLDEQDVAIHALRIPGTGLEQAIRMQRDVEAQLTALPEVKTVFTKIGTAEIATDPMPPAVSDVFVIMKPRKEWPDPKRPKSDLLRTMEERLGLLPGNAYEFTQPIAMRFNELIAGVRSDVAVKVFGDDLESMLAAAHEIEEELRKVPGAADVKTEHVSGLPVIEIDVDRAQAARFGLSTADVQEVIRTALAGSGAGEVFEGDRRFEIVVRLDETARRDISSLELLPVPVATSRAEHSDVAVPAFHAHGRTEFVQLGMLADIHLEEGPNQVSRENGKRRVVVQANVRGRDLGSFVKEARTAIDANVELPTGSWITWGGQFENLIAARQRLAVVVPLALLLILALLAMALRDVRDALLVFTGVPLALTGGVLALPVRALPFSVGAAIGFIALSGVAVLNGLVMVSFVRKLQGEGRDPEDAILEGCRTRLRPVLMTALVASLGFLPMALATGTGAEVQRPLATVVIGGILSSTALTLVVLPALMRATTGRPR